MKNKSIKTGVFRHAMTHASQVFARNKKLKVVFQGDQAGTDGETIYYPSMDLTGELSEDQVAIARGYADHETGHCRHTDLNKFRRYASKAFKEGKPFKKSLLNGIEDPRMEARVIRDYPGARENLNATTNAVAREFLEQYRESPEAFEKEEWYGLLPVLLANMGRKHNGQQGTDLDEFLETCRSLVGAKNYQQAEQWAEQITGLASTHDACKLTDRIFEQLVDQEQQQGQETPGSQHQQPEGEQVHGQSESNERESSADEEHSESTEASQAAGHSGFAEDAQCASGDPAQVRLSVEEKVGQQQGKTIEVTDVLQKAVNNLTCSSADLYRPYSSESERWHNRHSQTEIGQILADSYNPQRYEQAREATAGHLNTMRRKLERALCASEQRRFERGLYTGRLDSSRLPAALAGNPLVFKRRYENPGIDTAVTLMIDCSGSMQGTRIKTAMQATIALCEALEKTRVAYECIGFASWRPELKENVLISKRQANAIRNGCSSERYSHWLYCDMILFKSFNERLRQAKQNIGGMESAASNSVNIDGESLLYAHGRLSQRPEQRKVMIVLSDGQPNASAFSSFGQGHLADHLRQVIDDIEGQGTDMVGIGIQSAAVEQFYNNHCVLWDVKDLPKIVLDQVCHILLGKDLISRAV